MPACTEGNHTKRKKEPLDEAMKKRIDDYFTKRDPNNKVVDKPMSFRATLFDAISNFFPTDQWKDIKDGGNYEYLCSKCLLHYPISSKSAKTVRDMTKNRIKNQRASQKASTGRQNSKQQETSSSGGAAPAAAPSGSKSLLPPVMLPSQGGSSAAGCWTATDTVQQLSGLRTEPSPYLLSQAPPHHPLPALLALVPTSSSLPPSGVQREAMATAIKLLDTFKEVIKHHASRNDPAPYPSFCVEAAVVEAFLDLHNGLMPLSLDLCHGVNGTDIIISWCIVCVNIHR